MISKKFKTYFTIIVIVVLFAVVYVVADVGFAHIHLAKYPYMAGATGKHCYLRNNGHGNIKYHRFFETLEECERYVNK